MGAAPVLFEDVNTCNYVNAFGGDDANLAGKVNLLRYYVLVDAIDA